MTSLAVKLAKIFLLLYTSIRPPKRDSMRWQIQQGRVQNIIYSDVDKANDGLAQISYAGLSPKETAWDLWH